jgi:hypothetical protein
MFDPAIFAASLAFLQSLLWACCGRPPQRPAIDRTTESGKRNAGAVE